MTEYTPVSREEAVSILGEGIHTGMRKGSDRPDSMVLHRAVNDHLRVWTEALEFFVDGLDYMGMALCKKEESDERTT